MTLATWMPTEPPATLPTRTVGYYTVLGLHKEPFSTSPDPTFFYESREHRTALTRKCRSMLGLRPRTSA